MMSRILRRALLLPLLAGLVAALPGTARADDKVVIGTDWRAEAEHGGIYQALARGIYKKYRLDVEIRQGGPNLNQAQLLAAGRYDFAVQSNSFEPLNFVKNGVPIVAVAAAFQKDPQVLIAHAGSGLDTLGKMKGKPILISAASRENFWQFLRVRYGFADEQIRPYTFNLAPFLADKNAIMQGYLTSEPYAIELATDEKPLTILLADQGYRSYGAMIAATQVTIEKKPDLVQRMVDATLLGWISYLNEDASAANALIKRDNPEMTDAIIAHAIAGMKQYGIVQSGDAQTLGVGAMTDARWQEFFAFTAEAGIYPKDLPYRKGYTLAFVNHKLGLAQ
ncbi:MAG TPA: ABC transporter substrate-binding protein [Aliidongia sp.]|uniref:ABC transporter substrate-binding protein n=1 Tax=Aliidongia sp. TaxID=1914230 RepID=UPI002DDDAFB8|nr:ABC transporter substrate-binding protein [Aliidongia sp.]HEV2676934.1 ABC transporter substrate-binding protein [Aliidongia sp.]